MANNSHYKEKLETQKKALQKELATLGHVRNVKNPDEWEAVQPETNDDPADKTEVAEAITEYESNTAVLKQIETDLYEIDEALMRIENNTYGFCEVCKKEIEEERLEANPAARTCIEHRDTVL